MSAPRIVLSLFVAWCAAPWGTGAERIGMETGRPALTPLRLDDRAEGRSNTLAVDARGRIYVSAADGTLLEHDGRAWREIALPPTVQRESLQLGTDASGIVYLAGTNLVGRLDADESSGTRFVSLREQLPADERERHISRLATRGQDIFFLHDAGVWRWRDGRFDLWSLNAEQRLPGGLLFAAGERVFAFHARTGLQEITEEGPRLLPAPEGGWPALLAGIVRDDAGGWIALGASPARAWQPDTGATAAEPGDFAAAVRQRRPARIEAIPGGWALRFVGTGPAALFDADFRLRAHLDPEPSQSWSRVLNFCVTPDALWLLTPDRLLRHDFGRPASLFTGRDAPGRGEVRDFARHAGRLYAATADGVYRLEPGTGQLPARFVPLPGAVDDAWFLQSHATGLLVGGRSQVDVWDGEKFHPGPRLPFNPLSLTLAADDPDLAFLGTVDGVAALRCTEGQWKFLGVMSTPVANLTSLQESAPGTLWAGTAESGVTQLTLRTSPVHAERLAEARARNAARAAEGVASAPLPMRLVLPNSGQGTSPFTSMAMTHYGEDEGLAFRRHEVRVLSWGGQPVFATSLGVLEYAAAAGRFVPRLTLPHDAQLLHAESGRDGSLWLVAEFVGRRRLGRLRAQAAEPEWRALPPAVLHAPGRITALFEDDADAGAPALWLGGDRGVLRLDLVAAWPEPPLPRVQVAATATDRKAGSHPLARAARLPDGVGSVGFTLAAPLAPAFEEWRVESRLRDREEWQAGGGERSFGILPPGDYVFEARLADSRGRHGPVTDFAFTIAPPWWRTPPALALGAALAAVLLVGFVRWRIRRLRRANERLEQQVRGRTDDLARSEAQLRVAKESAESANRAKSAFLANMSHELRTPLNAVLGYAQILRRDTTLSGEQHRRLDAIIRGGEDLLGMINEVLDLSKVEAGRIELNPRPCSLPSLLAGIVEQCQLRAAQQGLAFGYRQDSPLPETVLADEARLRQVLTNLLGNALKFTAQGRVDLAVGREGHRIRFTVSDTGPGIAPAEQARIFQPFHQATLPGLAAQGAGLGLAISQRLVGLMGGAITLVSAPGEGSRFSFAVTLPVATMPPPEPARPRITGYHGPRRRVLLVDDEAVNRQVLREILHPLGFLLAEAEDGEEAVQAALRGDVEAVLMDLRLPRLDGLTATRRLRETPAGRRLRIIAISASVFAADRTEAIEAGCDEFLPKPFREETLLALLGRLLHLDWATEPAAPDPAPAAASALEGDRWPPRRELALLARLVEQGDVLGVRRQLDEIRRAHPDCAGTARRLDQLAAEFQMTRLSEILAARLSRSHEDASAG